MGENMSKGTVKIASWPFRIRNKKVDLKDNKGYNHFPMYTSPSSPIQNDEMYCKLIRCSLFDHKSENFGSLDVSEPGSIICNLANCVRFKRSI